MAPGAAVSHLIQGLMCLTCVAGVAMHMYMCESKQRSTFTRTQMNGPFSSVCQTIVNKGNQDSETFKKLSTADRFIACKLVN